MSSKAIPAETPLLSASNLLSTALSTLKSSPDAPPSAEALKSLDLSLKILTSLDPYMEEHSNAPPPGFQELSDATVNEDWDGLYEQGKISIKLGPQFSAGPYEGMFVAQVAKSIKAKRVLEIGMFTGTTTLCVAHALPKNGGQIVALEVVDYLETFVTPHFEKAGVKDRIEVMTGKADDALDQLRKEIQSGKAEPFDLIFIDADKGGYKTYWKKILEGGLLRKGGTMLIDNTLYKGTPLVDSSTAEEIRSRVPGIGLDNADALREFNEIVKDEKRCESTILPIRDGVTWVNLIE